MRVETVSTGTPGVATVDGEEIHVHDAGDISSQELLKAAELGEGQPKLDLAAINRHPLVVFRGDFADPDLIFIDEKSTVGSITVADERLGIMEQPVAVSTCLGSPVKLSESTSPYQQVFLRDFRVCEPGVQGVRPQFLSSIEPCPRIQLLRNQEAWVAEDEMNHYLRMIGSSTNVQVCPVCVIRDDIEEDKIESTLFDWFRQVLPDRDAHTKAISAFLVKGHWFPVVVTPAPGKVVIHVTPSGASWVEIAIRCQGIEYTIIPVAFPLITKFNNDCGFQTVAWLMDATVTSEFGEPLRRVPPIEISTAIAWRGTFEHHLTINGIDQTIVVPAEQHYGGAEQFVHKRSSSLKQSPSLKSGFCQSRTGSGVSHVLSWWYILLGICLVAGFCCPCTAVMSAASQFAYHAHHVFVMHEEHSQTNLQGANGRSQKSCVGAHGIDIESITNVPPTLFQAMPGSTSSAPGPSHVETVGDCLSLKWNTRHDIDLPQVDGLEVLGTPVGHDMSVAYAIPKQFIGFVQNLCDDMDVSSKPFATDVPSLSVPGSCGGTFHEVSDVQVWSGVPNADHDCRSQVIWPCNVGVYHNCRSHIWSILAIPTRSLVWSGNMSTCLVESVHGTSCQFPAAMEFCRVHVPDHNDRNVMIAEGVSTQCQCQAGFISESCERVCVNKQKAGTHVPPPLFQAMPGSLTEAPGPSHVRPLVVVGFCPADVNCSATSTLQGPEVHAWIGDTSEVHVCAKVSTAWPFSGPNLALISWVAAVGGVVIALAFLAHQSGFVFKDSHRRAINIQVEEWVNEGFPSILSSREPCTRSHLLQHQQAWVAADEMEFYVQRVCRQVGISHTQQCIINPGTQRSLVRQLLSEWVLHIVDDCKGSGASASMLLVGHHWFPVVAKGTDRIQVHTTPDGASWIAPVLQGQVSLCVHDEHGPKWPTSTNACGFQAIAWLMQICPADPSEHTHVAACEWYHVKDWRLRFFAHLAQQGNLHEVVIPAAIPYGGVGTSNIASDFAELLVARGVPAPLADERASQVLSKLGRQPIAKALRSQNAWREIKQLANLAAPKVQLVLPSELEAVVQARIAKGTPFGDKKKKVQKANPKSVVKLLAEDIAIPDGIFRDANLAGISQIPLDALGPEAQGIVVVNAEQAVPYLRFAKPVSKFALALIVVDYQNPLVFGVGGEIRFPDRCERTSEPVLLTAKVIQIGNVEVTRSSPANPTQVDEVSTVVIRTCT